MPNHASLKWPLIGKCAMIDLFMLAQRLLVLVRSRASKCPLGGSRFNARRLTDFDGMSGMFASGSLSWADKSLQAAGSDNFCSLKTATRRSLETISIFWSCTCFMTIYHAFKMHWLLHVTHRSGMVWLACLNHKKPRTPRPSLLKPGEQHRKGFRWACWAPATSRQCPSVRKN